MRTFFIIFIIVFINNIYANDFFEDIGKGINQFFEDVGKLVSPDNPVEKYIKLKQTKGTKTEALKTAENEAIEFIEWHTKSLEDSYAYLAKLEYIYGTGNISAKEKNEIRRQEQYINYKNENLATMLKNLNSVLGNSTESENSDNLQNLREYISKTQEKISKSTSDKEDSGTPDGEKLSRTAVDENKQVSKVKSNKGKSPASSTNSIISKKLNDYKNEADFYLAATESQKRKAFINSLKSTFKNDPKENIEKSILGNYINEQIKKAVGNMCSLKNACGPNDEDDKLEQKHLSTMLDKLLDSPTGASVKVNKEKKSFQIIKTQNTDNTNTQNSTITKPQAQTESNITETKPSSIIYDFDGNIKN